MNSDSRIRTMNHRWHDLVVDERCTPNIRAAITKGNIVGGFPYQKHGDQVVIYVPEDEPDAEERAAFAIEKGRQVGVFSDQPPEIVYF